MALFGKRHASHYPQHATTRNDLRSSGHQNAAWIGAVVLALVFVSVGLMKVLDVAPMREMFASWGYPSWFMYVIGVLEIVGAAYVLIPRVATYGSSLLTLIMIGAIATHITAAEWFFIPLPLVFGALAAYVAWARLPDAAGIRPTARTTRHY